MSTNARWSTLLDQVEGWEAPHAAAAIVVPGRPPTTWGPPDLELPLASVTKLLTAFAVLVAVEEGTLSLEQPAGPPGATVAHLLAHASGLGPDGGVVAPPAARRIYSNAGFEELGRALAAASGMTVAAYLQAGVLDPLGMAHTTLRGSPAHGAVSTAADLARFAAELLEPTLLAPATLTTATQPVFAELAGVLPGFGRHDPNPWGLGFEVRGRKAPHWTGRTNSPRTFGHFGRTGTFLWVDPALDLALVALTDRPFGPWATAAWPRLSDDVVALATAARPPGSKAAPAPPRRGTMGRDQAGPSRA